MSSHLVDILRDMPSGLKKVTFEQMFFENSQLSKYIKEYIDQNRSKIAPKLLKTTKKDNSTMTDEPANCYDQAAQTTMESKDQYVQHEYSKKDQINQVEVDLKEQFMQTDEIAPPKLQFNIESTTAVSQTSSDGEKGLSSKKPKYEKEANNKISTVDNEDILVTEADLPTPKKTTAPRKTRNVKTKTTKPVLKTKRRTKKVSVVTSDQSEIPETPQKRRSLIAVDVPVKKRKIEKESKEVKKATFSRRGAAAEKTKKNLK